MASHWTSKNAILRDLSLAQGREVPVELENTVGYNEKPPVLSYTEDTEEEFYSNCVGGGDLNSGPDLDLIQQMLDMVREVNITEIEDNETKTKTVIEISKINTSPQNVKTVAAKIDNDLKTNNVKCKRKKKRNIAMDSIIATYGYTFSNNNNEKCDNIASSSLCQYQKLAMFKKKSPSKASENMENNKKNDDLSENNCAGFEPAKFVPSPFAGETYKKYVEMNKIQEQVKENIWSEVERKMKEIDQLKNHDRAKITAVSPTINNQEVNSSELKGMDYVRLPQHRHLLTGECKVCQVLCVHSKEEIEKNSEK